MKLTHWAIIKAKTIRSKHILVKTKLTKPQATRLMKKLAEIDKISIKDYSIFRGKGYWYSIIMSNDGLDKLYK